MIAATTVSMMNGIWIVKFEAPTSRMMPVSRRRLNAVCRIVVAMSRVAHSTMSTARAIADHETTFMKVKNLSSSCFWSCTLPTPGAPWNELAMTSNLLASVRDTRNESANARSVAWSPSGLLRNWSRKRWYASAWLS